VCPVLISGKNGLAESSQTKLRSALSGLALAGLIAGAGLTVSGCTTASSGSSAGPAASSSGSMSSGSC
jgi:hypothetical protein